MRAAYSSLCDVHRHCLPEFLSRSSAGYGLSLPADTNPRVWGTASALARMDDCGVGRSILSVDCTGVVIHAASRSGALSRACNDELAAICAEHPDRLSFWAAVPAASVDGACTEAARALDRLGAFGVVLPGSIGDVRLGDPVLEPLMDELDARHAAAFVHPNVYSASAMPRIAGFETDFFCDVAGAAFNLIRTGSLARHPNIRFVLAHAGGFMLPRMDFMEMQPGGLIPFALWQHESHRRVSGRGLFSDEAAMLFRRFYYDTAHSASAGTLNQLKDTVGAGHMLFGSNYPAAPGTSTLRALESFRKITDQWSDADRRAVMHGNADSLAGGGRR
ncbi:MAG: amidohydrolase family protein [Desulfovibrionaceae bacterium]|nr:amidohydrolase family protein [Desulfovibrionaceae bacterium]